MENSTAAPATLAAAPKESVLGNQLDEHASQLQKLVGLLSQLESKLEPIMSRMSVNEDKIVGDPSPSSPIVNQLRIHTSVVKALQGHVQNLINDLEV